MPETAAPEQKDGPPEVAERIEVARIREKYLDAVQELNEFRGDTRITVRPERIIDVLTLMRDDPDLQFNFFAECLGVDYLNPAGGGYILGKPQRFEVVY